MNAMDEHWMFLPVWSLDWIFWVIVNSENASEKFLSEFGSYVAVKKQEIVENDDFAANTELVLEYFR